MKPEQYNVEDLFRSAFENASLEPPRKEDMWAAIQSAVQNKPAPVIPIFRTRWFKVSIAASIVLLLGAFYYFSASNSPQESLNITNKIADTEQNVDTQKIEKQSVENDNTSLHKDVTVSKYRQNNAIGSDNNTKPDVILSEQPKKLAVRKENVTTIAKNKDEAKTELVEKQDSKSVVAAVIPNKIEGEQAFAGVQYEIMEIVALASPEIVIPFATEKQPILQLVAIIQPSIAIEKTKTTNTLWVGFSGFYNSYKPNFQFNTPDLPSPFIKGKLSSINFSDSSNVAKDIRENMAINSSLSLNIDFGKVIGKYWFVRSGLSFSSTSYSVNSPVIELLAEPNPTNPTVLGKTKVVANTINSATTVINIPIQFGYQSDKKGLNYFVGGGLSADILLNNSLTSTYSPAVYDFGNYKALNMSIMGNAGLLYNITSQFSTLVEFNYRRSLTSVSDAAHYSSNPQWIGVGVGIRKKF